VTTVVGQERADQRRTAAITPTKTTFSETLRSATSHNENAFEDHLI